MTTQTKTDLTVANTIREQLGGKRFDLMTGAKNFTGSDRALSFQIGRNAHGVTHVRVELNGRDLYDVKFFAVRGTSVKPKGEANDVYAEQLRATFTCFTGLYTSL